MHSNLVWSPPFQTNFEYPSKTVNFDVTIQTPRSRRGEIRVSKQLYPIWTVEYELDHARGGEQTQQSVYQYLLGFVIAMGGQLSDFLYEDPNDNSAENVGFGLGDGVTTQFQLVRSIGIGTDIVQNLNGVIQVFADGILVVPASVGPTGIVTFSSPPNAGVLLTWTGLYYYRMRFKEADQTFDQFFEKIWSSKSIALVSVIL